jgi:hypothetical protein
MSQMKLHLAIKIPLWVRIFLAVLIQSASLVVDIDLDHQAKMLGDFIARHMKITVENVAV